MFKCRKSPREDPRIDWSKKRGVSRVLEHFKIIGARKFIKNEVDHAKLKFRVFLAYRTLERIVLGTKTWRGGYSWLIWPF